MHDAMASESSTRVAVASMKQKKLRETIGQELLVLRGELNAAGRTSGIERLRSTPVFAFSEVPVDNGNQVPETLFRSR